MSYLDNYLELIEDLSQELRDQFMEMRGLDLVVEQNIDSLETHVLNLFAECEIGGVTATSDSEYQLIRQDYGRTLEDADNKVNLASQMYDLVDRNLRHLDAEINKLKCELEIDNVGSTELLEKRSLELDTPSTSQQKRFKSSSEKGKSSNMSDHISKDKQKPTMPAKTVNDSPHEIIQTINNTLDHTGDKNAITVATSQAKPAARQVGKRKKTGKKRVSSKTVSTGFPVNEFEIGQELAGAVQTAAKSTQQGSTKKKKRTTAAMSSTSTASTATSSASSDADAQPNVSAPVVLDQIPVPPQVENPPPSQEESNEEWSVDPNEPRYCVCNDVSHGDMIACDNVSCRIEWFHYRCVGVTIAPEGNWYCPRCRRSMKQQRKKKN